MVTKNEFEALDDVKASRFHGYDYNELIDTMKVEIYVQADDQDYQGDSIYLIRKRNANADGEKYFGILVFGWGSCSGCDSAQAVENAQEATALRNDLYNGIVWVGSTLDDVRRYVDKRDWKGTWLNDNLVKDFQAQVKGITDLKD